MAVDSVNGDPYVVPINYEFRNGDATKSPDPRRLQQLLNLLRIQVIDHSDLPSRRSKQDFVSQNSRGRQ